MYMRIIKDPVKSIEQAKRQKQINRTVLLLLESCIVFGIASALAVMRNLSLTYSSLVMAASSGISFLGLLLIASVITAFVIEIILRTLGGKGKYYEALTAVSYSLVPVSAGFLIASIMLFMPAVGSMLAFLFLLPAFALGMSLLYRSIKELFGVDTITSFLAVSVMLMTEFMSLYALILLGLLNNLGAALA